MNKKFIKISSNSKLNYLYDYCQLLIYIFFFFIKYVHENTIIDYIKYLFFKNITELYV